MSKDKGLREILRSILFANEVSIDQVEADILKLVPSKEEIQRALRKATPLGLHKNFHSKYAKAIRTLTIKKLKGK